MLSDDEPRYAAIGQEMARSGDWITPRLWGEPWFEKPPLLYWMSAAGFRLGLSEDLAPRLPVALASAGFLVFFWFWLRRHFGVRPAAFSVAILGTCAGWLAMSHVAVTDLPLAACFAVAMLLAFEGRHPLIAGLFLGLAVLAKSLVPLVLFLPALWFLRHRRRDLLLIFGACLLIAAPWNIAMGLRYGNDFWMEQFIKHQLGRFTSEDLKHVQPFWFYLPVLLALLFPWTPLVLSLFRHRPFVDSRQHFFLSWLVFGLLFFSASRNKLPGYLLPLLPPLAVLLALGLDQSRASARWLLAMCAALLWLVPTVAAVLPQALSAGLSRSSLPLSVTWAFPVLAFVFFLWWMESSGRRPLAVGSLVTAMAVVVFFLTWNTYPVLDRTVSARSFWRMQDPSLPCADHPSRAWHYSLNYYARRAVPNCN